MIQTLQGVKITPRGNGNRFASQNWPRSYAFGGWIYNADVSIGYSNSATEIKMSIVLETSSFSQTNAKFDINESDLKCGAGVGGLSNENWYDIDLEGVEFKNFLLYEYDFSIEKNEKVLNVTFKDYSIILDKIYIGLHGKQGYDIPIIKECEIQIPVRCHNCDFDGSTVFGVGSMKRNIGFSSYAGINNRIYNSFQAIANNPFRSLFNCWETLYNLTKTNTANISQFDLNGGFLILGTESATEEKCNTSPNVTYTFAELLSSLRRHGLKFEGAFLNLNELDFRYRNSHIGTLREVLQNWCSDLAYSFYCIDRRFIGIDLKKPINISEISKASDPTTNLGKNFIINSPNGGNSAILSFKSSCSLNNTLKQSVILQSSYPITESSTSKNVKRYVKVLPLHPVSLNFYNPEIISDINIYGEAFKRPKYETQWFDNKHVNDKTANFPGLDGRSYYDLDAAIALSNYSDTLRDLFVAQRAIKNNLLGGGEIISNQWCMANFNALGMTPICEIKEGELKSELIAEIFSNGLKNDVVNLNMESKYFKVFLGFYSEDLKNEIVEWEKQAHDSMYKYGVVVNGPLTEDPYVSPDVLDDISPTEGFYGKNGIVFTKISNNFTPEAKRYISVRETPFIDVLLYSGLVKSSSQGTFPYDNPNYPAFVPPGFSVSSWRIPTGLWVMTLNNEWGTPKEEFNRQLSYNFEDKCASKYSLNDSVKSVLTDSDRKNQDWSLSYFLPIADPSLQKLIDYVSDPGLRQKLSKYEELDSILTTYTNFHLKQQKHCQKLHIIIIPDTENHPNLNISFSKKGINKVNGEVLEKFKQRIYEIDQQKKTTETKSICSTSTLEEICEDFVPQCKSSDNENNNAIDSFENIYQPNSRTLNIQLTKNPAKIGVGCDVNGDYYFQSLIDDEIETDSNTVNLEIVYPIQSYDNGYPNFNGLLQTDINTNLRLPAKNQIYGSPIFSANNNTSSLKLINIQSDDSLNPILNPFNNEIVSYMTVLTGNGSVILTPAQYYLFLKNLNNYELNEPMKNVNFSLAGPPSQFGNFLSCLNPSSGLTQMSISISDNGVKTNLSFSDRPKELPKQEAILNKIGPRIKGNYN